MSQKIGNKLKRPLTNREQQLFDIMEQEIALTKGQLAVLLSKKAGTKINRNNIGVLMSEIKNKGWATFNRLPFRYKMVVTNG